MQWKCIASSVKNALCFFFLSIPDFVQSFGSNFYDHIETITAKHKWGLSVCLSE